MVSSQTGSGKTAAFLLPVLHTLLAAAGRSRSASAPSTSAWPTKPPPAAKRAPKRKRKDPTEPAQLQGRHARRADPVPDARTRAAGGARRHRPGQALPRPAHRQRGGRHALPDADRHACRTPTSWSPRPAACWTCSARMQIKLDQVQFLVVDEADRMLDLGFADDLAEVNQLTIERQQTMMFSATFAPRIQQLAARVMRQPQRVQIDSPQEKHANIKQVLFWADNPQHKRKLLDHWLRDTTHQPGHRVRQHAGRVRRPGQRPAAGRLRRRGAARRPEPGPAQPPPDGAAPGPGADPGGHRRRRPRHRRADHHARLQLRPADEEPRTTPTASAAPAAPAATAWP